MTRTRPIRRRLLLTLVSVWLGACGPDADPSAIESSIEDGETTVRALLETSFRAVREREPFVLLQGISPEFRSEDGLEYADVQSILMTYLMRPEGVGLRVEEVEVHEDSPRVNARVRVLLALGANLSDRRAPIPPNAVRYRLDLEFSPTGDRWQLTGGRYTRL